MCLMDWRLGRFIKPETTIKAGTSVSYPANRQRVGFTVWGFDDGGEFIVRPNQAAFAVIFNVLNINGNPYHITLATHGLLVQGSFTITSVTGVGANCLCTEYTMPEWMLAMDIDKMASDYPALKIPPQGM